MRDLRSPIVNSFNIKPRLEFNLKEVRICWQVGESVVSIKISMSDRIVGRFSKGSKRRFVIVCRTNEERAIFFRAKIASFIIHDSDKNFGESFNRFVDNPKIICTRICVCSSLLCKFKD